MKRNHLLLVALFILVGQFWAFGQVKNEGLANQIIAARQKNAKLLPQYNWNSLMQYIDNGTTKDTRIDAVSVGPDGSLQRSVINDEQSALPRGFLRHAAAENERKEVEKYFKGLNEQLNQYTLSSAGAMINFISQATIQTGQAPDGTPTLTMSGTNVVSTGDTVTFTVNPTNFQPLRMEIATTYDGHAVTMSASFKTMKSGFTHLQFTTILIPDKNITVQIHNYDYVAND